ncbi:hypothetical protein AOQ84DRAFT_338882 [Glonium stellatum]|uniref:Heterokaryon incompatibility domain-containing protein n=1 Tax=Glonium stellatum TaxID=574774 RepID=A0A8E2F2Q0_9PEZI|nr:hypothetical protein AOQ84DRAFT_338882 [Glonium stellatum]
MERRSSSHEVYAVAHDPDLEQFLRGAFQEPEERVKREGVPDYRPEQRIDRRGSYIWRSSKPKIYARATIQLKLKKFGYFPVSGDQIRLLRIRPGKPDEPLDCELIIKSLTEVQGRYEALSYCWGRDDPSEMVRIRKLFQQQPTHGATSSALYSYGPPRDFPVRTNLYDALHHLRSEHRATVLWVDAICIDQNETAEAKREKEQQLSMMKEIYNSAKNVCIWLGNANDKSRDAFRFVQEVMNFRTFDAYVEAKDDATKERWCNLIETLRASWFSRRWIIQEVASARRASVHCGEDVVHWDDLADAISLLNEKADILKRQFDDKVFAEIPILSATHLVKAIVNVCRKSQDGEIVERLLDLETLVSTFQQFQATFPEDIIHSVRSLAKDAPRQDEDEVFRTTVEQKKSTRDLFIAYVNRCIKMSRSLDIICRHWAPPPTDTAGEEIKLPSWVSELSKSPFGLPGQSLERENGENFVAMSPNDNRKRYNSFGKYAATQSSKEIPSNLAVRTTPLSKIVTNGSRGRSISNPHPTPLHTISESFQNGKVIHEDHPPLEASSGIAGFMSEKSSTSLAINTSEKVVSTDLHREIPTPSSPSNATTIRRNSTRRSTNAERRYTQRDDEHNEKLSGILFVHGFILGTIKRHSDVMRDGIVPGDWLKILGWDRTSKENRVPDIIWRMLVADRTTEGGKPPSWYQRACLHSLRDARVTDSRGNLRCARAHKTSEMTLKFLRRVESVVWNRRIFQMESKVCEADCLFGLAPETTEARDIICILFGCSVPVVLRRVDGQTGAQELYELVGEAYVHGKMDGEAVQNKELVKEVRRTFFLR